MRLLAAGRRIRYPAALNVAYSCAELATACEDLKKGGAQSFKSPSGNFNLKTLFPIARHRKIQTQLEAVTAKMVEEVTHL